MLVAVLTIAITALASAPAKAEDGPGRTFNGGGGQPATLSADDVERAAIKSAFATSYFDHRRAGGTLASFPGGLGPLELALNGGRPFDTASPMAYPANNSYNSLGSPSYQAQETNYYCGPASAWVALKHKGAGNNHFGAALTQSNLATSYWLQTTNPDGTPRGSNWTKTLNEWTDGIPGGFYVVHSYGSYAPAEDVASKFTLDIDAAYAPIMNVWMTGARGWLPSWQNKGYSDVKHYVPGFGYSQYGDYLNYIEVFGSVGAGYYSGVTKELFAGLVASYGMIY